MKYFIILFIPLIMSCWMPRIMGGDSPMSNHIIYSFKCPTNFIVNIDGNIINTNFFYYKEVSNETIMSAFSSQNIRCDISKRMFLYSGKQLIHPVQMLYGTDLKWSYQEF